MYCVEMFKNARDKAMKQGAQIHWVRLTIAIVGFIVLSFAFVYLLQKFVSGFDPTKYNFAHLAYAIIFATALVSNLTIIAPVPFAVAIMIAAATKWNPALIALSAAIGGTIGELSGYYAGYLGKKLALSDNVAGYKKVESWIQRYGIWTISFLAFQPLIPFDIGGLVAGAARMPLHKFLLALFIGKLPKYIILVYAGTEIINYIPFFTLP